MQIMAHSKSVNRTCLVRAYELPVHSKASQVVDSRSVIVTITRKNVDICHQGCNMVNTTTKSRSFNRREVGERHETSSSTNAEDTYCFRSVEALRT